MSTKTYATPHRTALEGFRALVDRLGTGRAVEFIKQYEQGRGDYTRERRRILHGVTLAGLKRKLLPR